MKETKPRLEFLREQYADKLTKWLADKEGREIPTSFILQAFQDADPRSNKSTTQWLMQTYLRNGFLYEDIEGGVASKAHETLISWYQFQKSYLRKNAT